MAKDKNEILDALAASDQAKSVEDVIMELRIKSRIETIEKVSKADISKASVEELREIVKDLFKIISG